MRDLWSTMRRSSSIGMKTKCWCRMNVVLRYLTAPRQWSSWIKWASVSEPNYLVLTLFLDYIQMQWLSQWLTVRISGTWCICSFVRGWVPTLTSPRPRSDNADSWTRSSTHWQWTRPIWSSKSSSVFSWSSRWGRCHPKSKSWSFSCSKRRPKWPATTLSLLIGWFSFSSAR